MPKYLFTLCLLAFLATTVIADDTPATVALLVNEANADIVAARVGPALAAKDSVTRAAVARVALVRGLTSVLPELRTALTMETDPDAAREEVRAPSFSAMPPTSIAPATQHASCRRRSTT
jgi:hypothetical protein